MPYKDPKVFKSKQRTYSRAHYERNTASYISRARDQRKAVRAAWTAYKKSKSCKHCKASHPAILDFHHVIRTNKKSVTAMIARNNLQAAIHEAETKCIPLCSNCHRILHWNEQQKKSRKREKAKRSLSP